MRSLLTTLLLAATLIVLAVGSVDANAAPINAGLANTPAM